MRWQHRLAILTLTCLVVAAVLPGCSIGKVRIAGKLLKNGEPLKTDKNTMVTLTFVPHGEKKGQQEGKQAKFYSDSGTFEIELVPGNYRVRYIIAPNKQTPITSEAAPLQMRDKVYELTSNQELNIDIVGLK